MLYEMCKCYNAVTDGIGLYMKSWFREFIVLFKMAVICLSKFHLS